MSKEPWDWTQWTTFGIAVGGFVVGAIGAALSTVNWWQARHVKMRVHFGFIKQRIEPEHKFDGWESQIREEDFIALIVVNLSNFPVMVRDIGLCVEHMGEEDHAFQSSNPNRILQGREAQVFPYYPVSKAKETPGSFHPYVRTMCGYSTMNRKQDLQSFAQGFKTSLSAVGAQADSHG